MKQMHIVIPNAHWSNRGDEAAHRALWEELQRLYPGCRITVMFKDRKPVTGFPDLKNASCFSCQFKAPAWEIWLSAVTRGRVGINPLLKKAVRTLATADLIIYPPGGSVINDRFFWSKQLEYLVPFLCARLYRIPMFVAAPSIGPFDADKPRRFRTWLLRTPRVFCVREDISKRYLGEIGIKDHVHVTMDLAFMKGVDETTNRQKLDAYPKLRDFLAQHEKTVGMTLSDFKWHVKLGKQPDVIRRIEETFRQLIDYLARQGIGILLIPQLFGNQNDADYLQTFAGGEHVFVMSAEPDCYFQQHVISRLHAVVGMRYHCNIFAAKMGVPFIAVVYEEKMSGFLDLAGLSEYSLSLEDVTFKKLDDKIQTLEKHHEQLRKMLRDGAKSWRDNARKTVELLSLNYF